MVDQVTNSQVIDVFSRSLRAANLRHQVISNNIANVNTPNFKKSEVVFETLLAKQLSPDTKKLAMARTNSRHLPLTLPDGTYPSAQIEQVNTTSMRSDNNNVDIDSEMASLAENNIYYNAVVRQTGDYFSSMKSVIKGQ